MTILLFPGRHLLQSAFQEQYLLDILNTPLDKLVFLPGSQLQVSDPIDTVVFAITSANHQFTRYNPIPFHIRAIGIDRFACGFATDSEISYRIFGIPHYAPSPRFATILIKEIAEQTENDLVMMPLNTVVLTSTLPIAEMFLALGFAILPAEATTTPTPATPQHLLGAIMAEGANWMTNSALRAQISHTTFALWHDFPEVPRRIFRLWHDPLLNDEGSLTTTRNYSTYTQGMSNEAIVDLKYSDIKSYILPGRIVDEGCADGALLTRIADDFPDSDLIGIEITGELISRCLERQRAGEFGEAFVHFHQRNLISPIFEAGTIHTTICNSTLHELWSYNHRDVTVLAYLRQKLRQLAPRGRLLIRDVIGPEDPDDTVYLWLNQKDGEPWTPDKPFQDVATLSTYSRFFRFAHDFLPQLCHNSPSSIIPFHVETVAGQYYIMTTKRLAVEYITKKDYSDNWASEVHEEFAFWSLTDWEAALRQIGFVVNQASHVYTNDWIVENRWKEKVALFRRLGDHLVPLPYPPTTCILIAEKPDASEGSTE